MPYPWHLIVDWIADVQDHDPPPKHKGWYRHRYLPHFDHPGVIQHVCFHLADSLPQAAIERIHWELRLVSAVRRKVEMSRKVHDLLDAGIGACLLRQPDLAQIVEAALEFGDDSRYRLIAWSIMPNHVHALIQLLPGWPLGKVVQAWKRHTTKELRAELARQGSDSLMAHGVWQSDYWDRFVRDEQHFERVVGYIENNPVSAGLVDRAESWPWGSARHRAASRNPELHSGNAAR